MLSSAAPFVGVEYEDDFLRGHVFHRLLTTPDDTAAIDALLARWEVVLEGGSSPFLDVFRSLLTRDPDEFKATFDALLDRRNAALEAWRKTLTYSDEIDATDRKVFVEGLAILRLAEAREMPTQSEYAFIPNIARVPLASRLPAPDAWQVP